MTPPVVVHNWHPTEHASAHHLPDGTMTDTRNLPTGDAEIDALFVEIEAALEEWGQLIDEQLRIAHRLGDLAAIDEEWSC